MLGVVGRPRTALFLAISLFWLALEAAAQQPTQTNPKQDIPDAPSASRPPQPFPSTPPPDHQNPSIETEQPNQPALPVSEAPPSSSAPAPSAQPETTTGPPPFKVTTVPEAGVPKEQPPDQQELYKIIVNTNQVIVPVRVTDESGRLVSGLLSNDFAVYEDGKKQKLNFFTSVPFALSAAVIIDLGMPDVAVQKVNKTFPALEGAFSRFDEVSIYTYGNTVARLADFSAAGQRLTSSLNELKTVRGENNGPPVTGGPLGPQGPTVNNIPMDPGAPIVYTPPKQSRVLNDAILAAARDLSTRDKTRRKMIFIISDGREYRSQASYNDVLKVLLSNGIMVYGIGVEGAAMPLYGKLERLHIPKQGYSDILPKYANATGGEVFNEYSRSAIEGVYARALEDARNQYTVGYMTRATPSSTYREVEVTVANHGPGCKSSNLRPCVNVYAKEGYYPLPVSR